MGQLAANHLDRHQTVQLAIPGLVNCSHAALANRLKDLVAAGKHRANGEGVGSERFRTPGNPGPAEVGLRHIFRGGRVVADGAPQCPTWISVAACSTLKARRRRHDSHPVTFASPADGTAPLATLAKMI